MNILMLTQVYSDCVSGGEGTAVWEMSNALAKRGLKIFIVTPLVRIEGRHHSNIKVHKIPFCKEEPLAFTKEDKLKAFFFSVPLIFLKRIDVIHQANTQGPNPFAKFKFGRKFVETADYPWEYDDSDFKKELLFDRRRKTEEAELKTEERSIFDRIFGRFSLIFYKIFGLNQEFPRTVDLYVCREKKTMEELRLKGYRSQLAYVPMGVDIERLNPEIKPIYHKDNKFVFLFIGRISKRKGTDTAIKSFNKISRKYPQAELVLVGSGINDYFRELAGDNPKIKFEGQKFGQELVRYFAYGDIFIQVSLSNFKGILKVVTEAMTMAKPVIINKAYDSKQIKEKIGFLVPPKNVNKLAETMEYAINHREELKKMGLNARQYAIKNHSWDLNAERLINAYRHLIPK